MMSRVLVGKSLVLLSVFLLTTTTAMADIGGSGSTNVTVTTSISSSTSYTNVDLPLERLDIFLTRLTGRIADAGPVVDLSFDLPFSDPIVQAAILQAQNALSQSVLFEPLTFQDPLLLTHEELLQGSNTQFVKNEFFNDEFLVAIENTIGPGTIIIGDRDNGGTAFEVLAGTTNINVNTHTASFFNSLFQTTDTYLTKEHYEIVANLSNTPEGNATVPEPATMVLFGFGMAGMGIRKIRQKRA